MKKFLLFGLACACGLTAAAEAGTTQCQAGYTLTNVYSIDGLTAAASTSANRSGVGINDKWYVVDHAAGIVKTYEVKDGALVSTGNIAAPAGHYMWVSSNLDAAGHYLVQLDDHKFDGYTSASGHGFMVIDTETNEVINDFVPMSYSGVKATDGSLAADKRRFDSMAPIDEDILSYPNTRILEPITGEAKAFQFSYNEPNVATDATYWKTAYFNVSFTDFPESLQKCTSTGYAMQYNDNGAKCMAFYGNIVYTDTYSGEGKYGNAIQKYTGNWIASGDYFYTPQHSGLTGFNIFNLDGKQYIIYPAGGSALAGDAFAIAEVTFTDSPLTDMTAPEERAVTGSLVARAYAATNGSAPRYTSSTFCTPSYHIEYVPDEDNSVYIYSYAIGAPANKWKFTDLVDDIPTGVEGIEAETDAPVEYFNLQGVRVANPESGVYIRRQGAVTTKVIL